MIEVLFGESEAASMKAGKKYEDSWLCKWANVGIGDRKRDTAGENLRRMGGRNIRRRSLPWLHAGYW
mgnify:CR=1 FL=1